MTRAHYHSTKPQKAVIYCRVSSKSQSTEGSGLDSQEHLCREHAASKGYEVVAVFPDDISGYGDFMKRPGMVALLKFLDDNPFDNFVVIFDDLKRYSRDTEFYLKLKREMEMRGAIRECPNFNFEDTPESKFVETVLAAQGELEREQNRRQVLQKMKARVEQGYWVFHAPKGYIYQKAQSGGKVLVPDPVLGPIVKSALDGFASGRLGSQVEVQRFLQSQPEFAAQSPKGRVRPQAIVRLLSNPVYAGMVYAKVWGVSLRPGKHEGLVSPTTHQKILEILERGVYAPSRVDTTEKFILRGAVSCASCGKPMTAGHCKGKTKTYAYFWCAQKGCDQRSKTISRDKMEADFTDLLKELQPTQWLLRLAEAMFRDLWDRENRQAHERVIAYQKEADAAEAEIQALVDRIVESSNARVISALERRIDAEERRKIIALEHARVGVKPLIPMERVFELSLKFLKAPYLLWESGRLDLRRLVLKLTFSEHLRYRKGEGFELSPLSLPFNIFNELGGKMTPMDPAFAGKNAMVPRGRIELPASSLPMMRSTTELPRHIAGMESGL